MMAVSVWCTTRRWMCGHVIHSVYVMYVYVIISMLTAESPVVLCAMTVAMESNHSNLSTVRSTTVSLVKQSTTTTAPPGEGEEEVFQEVDMVSIIVVGVLFVVILMICIILACRSKSSDLEALTEESNQLRLDVSTNPGYSETDGPGPATPPPTYSMIERQTSYVSQISMSSSQASVPPDYEEALELDSHGNPLPRRSSTMSSRNGSSVNRHSSNTSQGRTPVRSASGYARSRPRINRYHRSNSAAESSRPRYQSQASTISEVVPIEENSALETEGVFYANVTATTPDGDNRPHPTTSTPHVLEPGYSIETQREDSQAPLFNLGSISSSMSEAATSSHNNDGAPILDSSKIAKDTSPDDNPDQL